MQDISVVVTPMDRLLFRLRFLWARPVNRWIYSLVFVFCFVTTLNRAPAVNARSAVIALLVALIFVAGAVLLSSLLMAVILLLGRKGYQGTLGAHTFSITERGLVETSPYHESVVKWGGALKLLRTRRFICVQLNAGLYHLVPRRCFASADQDRQFWEAIQPLLTRS